MDAMEPKFNQPPAASSHMKCFNIYGIPSRVGPREPDQAGSGSHQTHSHLPQPPFMTSGAAVTAAAAAAGLTRPEFSNDANTNQERSVTQGTDDPNLDSDEKSLSLLLKKRSRSLESADPCSEKVKRNRAEKGRMKKLKDAIDLVKGELCLDLDIVASSKVQRMSKQSVLEHSLGQLKWQREALEEFSEMIDQLRAELCVDQDEVEVTKVRGMSDKGLFKLSLEQLKTQRIAYATTRQWHDKAHQSGEKEEAQTWRPANMAFNSSRWPTMESQSAAASTKPNLRPNTGPSDKEPARETRPETTKILQSLNFKIVQSTTAWRPGGIKTGA